MIAPIWESARSLASRPLLDQWWFERVPVVRSVCVCVVRRRIFLFSVMLALSRAPVKAEHRDPLSQSVRERRREYHDMGIGVMRMTSVFLLYRTSDSTRPFFFCSLERNALLSTTHTHTWLLNTEKKDKILNKLNILEQRINRQHTITFFE